MFTLRPAFQPATPSQQLRMVRVLNKVGWEISKEFIFILGHRSPLSLFNVLIWPVSEHSRVEATLWTWGIPGGPIEEHD